MPFFTLAKIDIVNKAAAEWDSRFERKAILPAVIDHRYSLR